MSVFKVIFNGELEDEVFNTEQEADSYALDLCNAYAQGGEDLYLSNPGDYPYEETCCDTPEYEIIEVDE